MQIIISWKHRNSTMKINTCTASPVGLLVSIQIELILVTSIKCDKTQHFVCYSKAAPDSWKRIFITSAHTFFCNFLVISMLIQHSRWTMLTLYQKLRVADRINTRVYMLMNRLTHSILVLFILIASLLTHFYALKLIRKSFMNHVVVT